MNALTMSEKVAVAYYDEALKGASSESCYNAALGKALHLNRVEIANSNDECGCNSRSFAPNRTFNMPDGKEWEITFGGVFY